LAFFGYLGGTLDNFEILWKLSTNLGLIRRNFGNRFGLLHDTLQTFLHETLTSILINLEEIWLGKLGHFESLTLYFLIFGCIFTNGFGSGHDMDSFVLEKFFTSFQNNFGFVVVALHAFFHVRNFDVAWCDDMN